MDKKALEHAYRHFLKVAGQWNDLVTQHSVFNDVNSNGEAFRFVGVTHDKDTLQTARALIDEWQKFADLCKSYEGSGGALNILEQIYLPVPFIIKATPGKTQIVVQGATSTRLMSREQLIKKYTSTLKKHSSSRLFTPVIQPLKKELEFFENEPEGEMYRARKTGFTEVAITVPRELNSNWLDRIRVGTHGALVFVEDAETPVPVQDLSSQKNKTTVYDGVKSIRCAILGDFVLYRLRDLDFVQRTIITRNNIQRVIEARNSKFKARSLEYVNSAPAGSPRSMARRKVAACREALKQLEIMDGETIDIMMASGDDLSEIKLVEMRAKYGKGVEEKHGVTFNRLQALAKIR